MGLLDVANKTPANPISSPTAPTGAQLYSPGAWIANARASLDSVINGYILRPKGAQGIGGFVFDYEGMTQLDADNEITDHFTEQNSFFNDHDAQKPITIILRGYIGEVVLSPQSGLTGLLTTIQGKLSTLPAILGKYTPGALAKVQNVVNTATNVVNQVDAAAAKAQNLYNLIAPSSTAPTKQAKAFGVLMAMRDNSVVFTLSTPWGMMARKNSSTNYVVARSFVIKHLTFIQDEFQKDYTDISVTVKEVQFVPVPSPDGQTQATATYNNSNRSIVSKQGTSRLGGTNGLPAPFSAITSAFGPRL